MSETEDNHINDLSLMQGAPYRRLPTRVVFSKRILRSYSSHIPKNEQAQALEQNGHQTFRVRRDGTTLPLPPILDPIRIAARTRWEQPKSRPDLNNLTPFQQKLYACSYGLSLATPTFRYLQLTAMRSTCPCITSSRLSSIVYNFTNGLSHSSPYRAPRRDW